MSDERLVQDTLYKSSEDLVLMEKYDDFLNYVYPIVVKAPRVHAVLRDLFLTAAIDQGRLFYEAAKSSQISKLYAADAGLALLRFHLRFMVKRKPPIITFNQHRTASVLIAEVGRMVGGWIGRLEARKPKKG